MLIQCDELPECCRIEPLSQDHVRRPVALEDPVRHEPIGCAFRLHLLRGLAKGKRLRLREYVGDQHVMVAPERRERMNEGDEVAGNETSALVNELVERVLSVRSRFAPVDRTGRMADWLALDRDVLTVAL